MSYNSPTFDPFKKALDNLLVFVLKFTFFKEKYNYEDIYGK